MPEAYTTFWSYQRCQDAMIAQQAGMCLNLLCGGPHRSQPSFRRAGVKAGDQVYPITVQDGALYIIAHVQVGAILTLEEYMAQHPHLFALYTQSASVKETFGRYLSAHPIFRYVSHSCTNEILVGEGSLLHFDCTLPPAIVTRLRYRSQRGERLLKHIINGEVKRSTSLQGIYRLSRESAYDFEQAFVAKNRSQTNVTV